MEDLVESLNKAISSTQPSKSDPCFWYNPSASDSSTTMTEEEITLVRAALDSGTISFPALFSGYREVIPCHEGYLIELYPDKYLYIKDKNIDG